MVIMTEMLQSLLNVFLSFVEQTDRQFVLGDSRIDDLPDSQSNDRSGARTDDLSAPRNFFFLSSISCNRFRSCVSDMTTMDQHPAGFLKKSR